MSHWVEALPPELIYLKVNLGKYSVLRFIGSKPRFFSRFFLLKFRMRKGMSFRMLFNISFFSFVSKALPCSAASKLLRTFSNFSKVLSSAFILKYLHTYLKGCLRALSQTDREQLWMLGAYFWFLAQGVCNSSCSGRYMWIFHSPLVRILKKYLLNHRCEHLIHCNWKYGMLYVV